MVRIDYFRYRELNRQREFSQPESEQRRGSLLGRVFVQNKRLLENKKPPAMTWMFERFCYPYVKKLLVVGFPQGFPFFSLLTR